MSKRPFYLIAHECNTVEKVAKALKAGANAVECDIQFKDGKLYVAHDNITFTHHEPLESYLQQVKALVGKHPQFALQIFDCKIDNPSQALSLLYQIRTNLTNGTNLNIIISVAKEKMHHFFDQIHANLKEREGIAIDEEKSPSEVSHYFRELGVKNHCYGYGISKWLGFLRDARPSIQEAIIHKAEYGIKLVYVWTLAKLDSMRDYLRMGVDGIFVDDPQDLIKVLSEEEFKNKVRLAERDEIAFNLPRS